jgi:hypothetical protein
LRHSATKWRYTSSRNSAGRTKNELLIVRLMKSGEGLCYCVRVAWLAFSAGLGNLDC